MARRFFVYIVGLIMMTIGIGFSIKSDLGVSPVSSLPYTLTLTTGIDMGKTTIMIHIILIFLQFLILRKSFGIRHLFQLPVAILFGYFTTFSLYLISFLPSPTNYVVRFFLLAVSIVSVAIGIFLYLAPNLIPLAGEGAMKAISDHWHIEYHKVKVGFDITMVVISVTTCLTVLRHLGSIGVGTFISAIFVGLALGVVMKLFKSRMDAFLAEVMEVESTEPLSE